MPGFTRGVMPVFTTLRMSMPVGVPRNPRTGMPQAGFSATVISYISCVAAVASCGVPPPKWTIAGAAAMAKAPIPAVSVMVESPMSGLASCWLNPGKKRPTGGSAGATNQRSPRPLPRARQRGRQHPRHQGRTRLVPIVSFVAHRQLLSDQALHVDAAEETQCLAHGRPQHVVDPAEAGGHIGAVCPLAQHLAIAFVEAGGGTVAE